MSNRFFLHVSIFIAIFSSSVIIGSLLYIDLYIITGSIKLLNFNSSDHTVKNDTFFKHSYKKSQFINVSIIDSIQQCYEKYGSEVSIKFNVADTIVVFILIGTISVGIIYLYTY